MPAQHLHCSRFQWLGGADAQTWMVTTESLKPDSKRQFPGHSGGKNAALPYFASYIPINIKGSIMNPSARQTWPFGVMERERRAAQRGWARLGAATRQGRHLSLSSDPKRPPRRRGVVRRVRSYHAFCHPRLQSHGSTLEVPQTTENRGAVPSRSRTSPNSYPCSSLFPCAAPLVEGLQ